MLSLWNALLSVEPALLARTLALLDARDIVAVMVYALEFGGQTAAELLREYAPSCITEKTRLLHAAAAHGCLRTVYTLRKDALPMHTSTFPAKKQQQRLAIATSSSSSPSATTNVKGKDNLATSNSTQHTCLASWVSAYRPYLFPEDVMYEAAKRGNLDAIQWLHTTTEYMPFLAVEHAARAGQLASAQWLAEHAHDAPYPHRRAEPWDVVAVEVTAPFDPAVGIFAWHAQSTASATRRNYRWKRVNRSGFAFRGTTQPQQQLAVAVNIVGTWSRTSSDPAAYAIEQHNDELFEVLKRSRATHNWVFTQKTLVSAVACGRLDALEWLLDNGDVTNYDVHGLVRSAVESNELAVLKWLDTRFALGAFSTDLLQIAMYSSSLDVVQWAYARFSSLPVHNELTQLMKGYLYKSEILMWLHATKGLCFTPQLVHSFARSGVDNLKMFLSKFSAHEQQAMLTATVLDEAAMVGNLDVVRYLVDERRVWSVNAARYAVSGKHYRVFRWLTQSHQPVCRLECSIDFEVAPNAHVQIVFDSWESVLSPDDEGEDDTHWRQQQPLSLYHPYRRSGDDGDVMAKKASVEAALAHCPDRIDGVTTLGAWAARHGFTDIFRTLIDLEYRDILSRKNLRRLLKTTSDGPLVHLFLERCDEPPLTYALFKWAAQHKDVALLTYLFARVRAQEQQHTQQARASSRQALTLSIASCVQLVVATASAFGHLSVLQWMLATRWSTRINPWASGRHGHVFVLQWLRTNKAMDEQLLPTAVQASVKFGHRSVLQWYRAIGHTYCFQASELERAVRRGDVDVVKDIASEQPELVYKTDSMKHKVEALLSEWQDQLCM